MNPEIEFPVPLLLTLLGIANILIKDIKINSKGDLIITIVSTEEGTHCHRCGRRITQSCGRRITQSCGHGQEVMLRHLPVFGRKCFIRIIPVRYECSHCKGKKGHAVTTSQKLFWYEPRSPHTKAFEEHILLELVNSTVEDVRIKKDLGYGAVEAIIERRIERQVDWKQMKELGVLGIDEIALKKGHKDFVTIVSAKVNGELVILAVLKDRLKATVKEFLLSIPKRLRRTVTAVCSDLYEGFINAAKEVFGEKVIVVDRFHVAKLYRTRLDKLRIKELKRLKQILSPQDYQRLKNVMWILRKQYNELTEEEREVLEYLFEHSPDLRLAYEFCNELTDIFNEALVKSRGRRKLESWIKRVRHSGLKCFNTFLDTLTQRMDEITNYFRNRHTSGFVEGLNNKIKVIKRRCYGLFNVGHLFQRIYLDLKGYELFASQRG
jgi:transposase